MPSPGFITGILQRFSPFKSRNKHALPPDASSQLQFPPPTNPHKRKRSNDSGYLPGAPLTSKESDVSASSTRRGTPIFNFFSKRKKVQNDPETDLANEAVPTKPDQPNSFVSPQKTESISQSVGSSSKFSINIQTPAVDLDDQNIDESQIITTWQERVAEESGARDDEMQPSFLSDLESPSHHNDEDEATTDSLQQTTEGNYNARHARQSLEQILSQERAKRNADAPRLASLGWSESDTQVFQTINSLSLMPVLPSTWVWDFRIFPDILFTSLQDDDAALIKPTFRNKRQLNPDVKGAKALAKLFELGPLARDDVILGLEPHKKMVKHMKAFVRWTLEEANLTLRHGILPNLVVHGGSKEVSPVTHQKALVSQLADLAQRWTDARPETKLASVPPLYGIIASGITWGIVSYVPEGIATFPTHSPDHFLRTIAVFDWKGKDMDVWHGFSFALLAVHCRDLLVALVDSEGIGRASPPRSPASETQHE